MHPTAYTEVSDCNTLLIVFAFPIVVASSRESVEWLPNDNDDDDDDNNNNNNNYYYYY